MSELRKIVVANWKMKLGLAASQRLAAEFKLIRATDCEVVVCPSFVNLVAVADTLKRSQCILGAQDAFWESEGAFTGEVSAEQLKEIGCRYVIIGHSERRQNLGETDEMVHRKIRAVLDAGLLPILCVGETLEERTRGAQDYVLIKQVTKALEGVSISSGQSLVIAYEPVWVIGSGQAIAPEQAGLAHQVIRQTLIDLFPLEQVKSSFRIIYGGSVTGAIVSSFTRLPYTSGVLIGGASLNSTEFRAILANV